jgi:predicted RNA binding protein YcfA (HicA-like mRNA interferase family)
MTAKELIKLLEKEGWFFVRQKGSHKVFKKEGVNHIITVPDHAGQDIGKGLLNKILKDAGLK